MAFLHPARSSTSVKPEMATIWAGTIVVSQCVAAGTFRTTSTTISVSSKSILKFTAFNAAADLVDEFGAVCDVVAIGPHPDDLGFRQLPGSQVLLFFLGQRLNFQL